MNTYEGLFIIRPDIKEEDVKGVFKMIVETITKNGGSVKKEDPWGKRQMAYAIRKSREAYYYKVDFEAAPAAIAKMEAVYKLASDNILRAMITKR